jgi:NADH-quinone oxidoreductase subunit L
MPKMGGLRKLIPHTYLTMLVSTLAISGFPFLAGFFSKDAILGETWGAGYKILWGVGVFASCLTAFYMFRLIKMTFFGEFRGTPEQLAHVHESPPSMTIPLWVLAGGAVLTGYWGIPKFLPPNHNSFEHFLEPIFPKLAGWTVEPHEMPHSTEYMLMMVAIAGAALGIGLAWSFYSGPFPFAMPKRIAEAFPRIYATVRDKYYVDELYERVFVNGLIKRGGWLLWDVDARLVDGVVNGTRHLTVGLSAVSSWFDRVFVDGAVNAVASGLEAAFRGQARLQNGRTERYALTMAFGVFGLVCVYLLVSP